MVCCGREGKVSPLSGDVALVASELKVLGQGLANYRARRRVHRIQEMGDGLRAALEIFVNGFGGMR